MCNLSSVTKGQDAIRKLAKAMPVLLTTEDEAERWLTAPVAEALELQRPLPSDQMMIVAKGKRKDEAA